MKFTRGDTFLFKFQRKNKDGGIITRQPNEMYFTVKYGNNTESFVFQKTLNDITVDSENYYHIRINPENKPQVNHIDGNKSNNNVLNLEWCNQSYNTKHAYKNNLIKHYKIEINQYDLEWNYIKTWESAKEIEKKLKIKNSQICRCCKNENSTAGGYHWKYKRKEKNICN